MREIKFRAWVKFESGNWGMLDNDNLQEWTLEDLTDNDPDTKLMQYTGIKDKNGKEIYEGDVVKKSGANWQITYSDGSFRLDNRIPLSTEAKDCEVIGNLYENPELLEE